MTRRILLVLLIALGLVAAPWAAEKERPLPKDLPPYGPLKTVSAPRVKEERLANGLTLWLVPQKGLPKVAAVVAVRGGMASDPKDRPGLSKLIAATIDQGTKSRTAKQIAEGIQAAGGDLTGDTPADAILIATDVLASKADGGLKILADILQNATFPESEVDLAKRNAADALRAQEADPSFLASRALAQAMFSEHPYGVVSPTQESIAKTTPDELRREYAKRFRPDQALLVVVGDFDVQTMTATLQSLFGSWSAPKEAPIAPLPAPPRQTPHAVFLVARPGSVQTTFAFGGLGPTRRDPDYAAAQVANAIYGGMFGSRMIKNIREDKGYTYSPGAFLQTRREVGAFQTRADVGNAVTGASFNEISYELNRMATTVPTEEEVTRARRFLVGVKALSLQSRGSVGYQLALLWAYGLPPEELGRESEKIQEVAAKDVEAVGTRYFPAARQTVVAVGEEKLIREQFAPFGLEVKPAP